MGVLEAVERPLLAETSSTVQRATAMFLCDWTGKTMVFESSAATVEELHHEIFAISNVPVEEQLLSSVSYQMSNSLDGDGAFLPQLFSTIHLRIRCLGGKGGFGAMLRGQQSRPGMKKVAPNTGIDPVSGCSRNLSDQSVELHPSREEFKL